MKTLASVRRDAEHLTIHPISVGMPGRFAKEVHVILGTTEIKAAGIYDRDQFFAYIAEIFPELGIDADRPTPWRIAMKEGPKVGERVVVRLNDHVVTTGQLVDAEKQEWRLDIGAVAFTEGMDKVGLASVTAWVPF